MKNPRQFQAGANSPLPGFQLQCIHGRMARGGDGHPKVSPGPAMPYPSTRFMGGPPTVWAASCHHLPLRHPMLYAYECFKLALGPSSPPPSPSRGFPPLASPPRASSLCAPQMISRFHAVAVAVARRKTSTSSTSSAIFGNNFAAAP
jgi:hypothetical protein